MFAKAETQPAGFWLGRLDNRLTCDRQQLKGLGQVLWQAAGCKVTHADAGAPADVGQELQVHNLAEV